jgi:DNA-binding NarL/FixJ family response regulator
MRDRIRDIVMTKILVADEHALYRVGLRIVIEAAVDDVEIIEADNFDTVMKILMHTDRIELALISLNMTGSKDPHIIRDLKRASSTTRYVMISTDDFTFDQVLHYIAEGFHGFISKTQGDQQIVESVQEVLAGRLSVPRNLVPVASKGESARSRNKSVRRNRNWQQNPFGLTPRQKDVLALLADGLSNREIAQALRIAESTTKIHVSALMKILNTRNRTEAAVLARNIFRAIEQDAADSNHSQ